MWQLEIMSPLTMVAKVSDQLRRQTFGAWKLKARLMPLKATPLACVW
jgi:hypothetical protein